ncbi:hypothetical protein [Roseibium sediminicola]|uniref:SPOR domain-containing protein n=1 Tax=Roseibium sediminicola TaxID=2933272 RepID=A0ABT0GQG3_9HYPH|nr:hypothetical protein [Roseibium sp. CAU 1639]MCK7611337.1 hypothetical protein [Roseibium sp. CAU 1639]
MRDLVRDTFTPSRVGLLSWAFAAGLMGTVGLASYQFSFQHSTFSPASRAPGGLALPPGGDVETTASISRSAPAIDVMQLPHDVPPSPVTDISQGQIEVLQKEVIGLRRRLSALSEQNVAYSRRIAALEKQVAVGKLAGSGQPASAGDMTAEPGPGVVITRAPALQPPTPKAAPRSREKPEKATAPLRSNAPQAAPSIVGAQQPVAPGPETQRQSPPRLISLYNSAEDLAVPSGETANPEEPVRIVQVMPATPPQVRLPESSTPPVSTGSIPTQAQDTQPEGFDATPTQTALRPKVITPSSPSGRLRGGGDRHLKRSDFGAIIGHYRTSAGAAKAWADFKAQNSERMRDLQPLLMQRQTAEGDIALMVGPFANAADAAVACLHLLDVTELCHPALFAGDPLVTAAKFRDTAF